MLELKTFIKVLFDLQFIPSIPSPTEEELITELW